jgi:hypothetical protein
MGALADEATVNEFANRLTALVLEAQDKGVVLEVRLYPQQPLRMSHFSMVAEARAAWSNGG